MIRRVLVTGGSRGIGRACAERFYGEGHTVIVCYNKSEAAAKNVPAAMRIKTDVGRPDEVKNMFALIDGRFGGVDILINNAGIAQSKLFTDITETDLFNMLNVNLLGAFRVAQAAARGMVSRKYGRIINISSVWGITGAAAETHYSAAKAGLIGFTKSLAKELAPSGVTVNCVAPGVIDTDMVKGLSAAEAADLKRQIPLGGFGTPNDVAELVYFLSTGGAGYITGQVMSPDGGFAV